MDSPVLINFMETCMEELMMPFKNTKIIFSKNNENLKLQIEISQFIKLLQRFIIL